MREDMENENVKDLEPKKIFMRALDPIHIGAGGYRLGRVDNTIVRDPATDIPKIPGTAIAGVVRAFYEIEEKDKDKDKTDKLFGSGESKGMLRFYDGQIIFFPVSSIQGTIWITTKELLEYWFIELNDNNGNTITIPDNNHDEAYALKGIDSQKPLNLGWLLLEVASPDGKDINLPSSISLYVQRIVIVSEKLFSHIVNDNLEIRTSVKIDSTTGTAAEGALFTYEAIPRGTILGFEVVKDKTREKGDIDIDKVMGAVSSYFNLLGIGGMGTRGFGRVELLNISNNSEDQEESKNAES
ncbi:type III-B CRISPR module RAMP protein Cmr4 [Petrotoga sp. 8T1HF07.NaAc.6.1]|uniref:type III-B CRISPR module RAMP protein Cmr4 n=1 Tax=Petrotoga sp. 8T1HF07.NaAc.6.1 TaxID=1351838 RepID=UPI00192AB5AE|nr:type III-B CRISPR module RAMP protein Cmr4 [Petrotoga sp. 8T1HF07.NaAc.6.1]